MKFNNALINRLLGKVQSHRVLPGDMVMLSVEFMELPDGMELSDGIAWVPLTLPHPEEQLENEAFTGRANGAITGYLELYDTWLVIAVRCEHALVWRNTQLGWVNVTYLTTV